MEGMRFIYAFFLLISCFTFSFSFQAFAQKTYIQKYETQTPTAQPQRDAQPSIQQPQKRSAEQELDSILNKDKPRGPRTPKEFANDYFKNCVKSKHPILTPPDMELLCGCTAAQFANGTITPAQIRKMKDDTPAGLKERNRMMLLVYAPCIEHPSRALILNQCLKSTRNQYTMKNQSATCRCLADGVSKDLQKNAPDIMADAVQNNPNVLDPLQVLLESKTFQNRQRYHSLTCIQKHELGGR